jgi:hypothetical protein
MLCDSCAWTNDFPEGTSHRWWHTLLPLDPRVLVDEPVDAQSSPSTSSSATTAQVIKINTNTSIADANEQKLPAKPFDTVKSDNATSLLPDFSGLSGVIESVRKLDDKISSLEEKVDASFTLTSETAAKSQVSVEERMSALERRMAGVEGKLDVVLGELKRMSRSL